MILPSLLIFSHKMTQKQRPGPHDRLSGVVDAQLAQILRENLTLAV